MLLKHRENAASRIAGLEPVCEWVLKEILLRALLVRFQGIVEDQLEVGGCRGRMSMRHKGGSEKLREDSRIVGDGEKEERHVVLRNVHMTSI